MSTAGPSSVSAAGPQRPERMPEDLPDRMPDRMSEDMTEDMSEDWPVTKHINVMVGITRSKVFFFFLGGGCFFRFIVCFLK